MNLLHVRSETDLPALSLLLRRHVSQQGEIVLVISFASAGTSGREPGPDSKADNKKENGSSEEGAGSEDEAEEVGEEAQDIAKDIHKPGNEGEKEKERRAPKIRGRTVKHAEELELKEKVKDALRGGLLEVRPKKAIDLVRKPW